MYCCAHQSPPLTLQNPNTDAARIQSLARQNSAPAAPPVNNNELSILRGNCLRSMFI